MDEREALDKKLWPGYRLEEACCSRCTGLDRSILRLVAEAGGRIGRTLFR